MTQPFSPFENEDTRAWLNKLGIWTIEQLPLLMPSKYLDLRDVPNVLEPGNGEDWQFVSLTLTSTPRQGKMANRPVVSFKAVDARNQSVTIDVMAGFDLLQFQKGDQVPLRCKVISRNGLLSVRSPSLVKAPQGRIVAIYAKDPEGRFGGLLAKAMHHHPDLLERAAQFACRSIGQDEDIVRLKAQTRYPEVADLLYYLHWPTDRNTAKIANEDAGRIVGYELLDRAKKHRERRPEPKSATQMSRSTLNNLIEAIPFPLTDDQFQSVVEICNDLHSPYPMYRLLSGDVGTGKTITFGVAAAACQRAGRQVAIVVPNETLANQMAGEFSQTWPDVPVRVISTGSKIKKTDLADHPILIGTQALTNRLIKLKVQPDLMILDEQHKMSVEQREAICGTHTNLLEATATCIPRTAGLVLLGGMDVSVLAKCPVNKTIHSRIVDGNESRKMFEFLSKIIATGKQVAVIYPMVESNDPDCLYNYQRAVQEWEKHFPGQVAGLNGRMASDEKQAVIDRMKRGEASVLISTTVIEVGITLPDLQALAVVKSDRFGVSQLHQLRGRVARKGGEGYFFMFCPHEISEDARERLTLLEHHADGFTLAEQDMRQRGFGNLEFGDQDGKSLSRIFVNAKLMPEDVERILARENTAPAMEGGSPNQHGRKSMSKEPSL